MTGVAHDGHHTAHAHSGRLSPRPHRILLRLGSGSLMPGTREQAPRTHDHATSERLAPKAFIGVTLLLAYILAGSIPWLALGITLLVAGYAYLSRSQVGRVWIALPLGIAGFWILVVVVQMTGPGAA